MSCHRGAVSAADVDRHKACSDGRAVISEGQRITRRRGQTRGADLAGDHRARGVAGLWCTDDGDRRSQRIDVHHVRRTGSNIAVAVGHAGRDGVQALSLQVQRGAEDAVRANPSGPNRGGAFSQG